MNKSDQINELAAALAKAQGEIQGAVKDSKNPFFKSNYADLASVWDACRAPLSKNNLAVIQTTEANEKGQLILKTILAHSSGQWISSDYPIITAKQDAQGMGSGMTYSRRYALAAMVGIVQVDDDGELASGRTPGVGMVRPEQPEPGDGVQDDTSYRIGFGQWKGRSLEQVYRDNGPKEIAKYIEYLEAQSKKKGTPISAPVNEFIGHAESFLGALENGTTVLTS